jgi:hypothetical protein
MIIDLRPAAVLTDAELADELAQLTARLAEVRHERTCRAKARRARPTPAAEGG